jgi:hypothetical protein
MWSMVSMVSNSIWGRVGKWEPHFISVGILAAGDIHVIDTSEFLEGN